MQSDVPGPIDLKNRTEVRTWERPTMQRPFRGEFSTAMLRVLVIGCGGAGKSTLAERIGRYAGLPVIHLDTHYWNAGWRETPQEAWQAIVEDLVIRDAWVMDGNYGGTMECRLAAADTVIFLDLPRWLCFWHVLKRRIRYHGRTRPDMGVGCAERVEWEFVKWIWNYRKNRRPAILERLRELEGDKQVIILESRAAVEQFMMQLSSGRYMAETAAGSQETQHEDLR